MGARRGGLILSAAAAVIGAACSLAPYIAVYAVTVALFVDDDPGRIPAIVGFTAAALVVRAVANGVATHAGHVAAYRILCDVRLAIGRKLGALPLGRVQARSAGEMKKILHDDVEQLEEALAHGIPDGAAAAAVPVATTIVLFVVDWRLALVALLALVLLVAVSAVGMSKAQKAGAEAAGHTLVLNRAVMGYLQGIKVIRGYVTAGSGTMDQARAAVLRAVELDRKTTSGPLRWLVAAMNVATALAVALLIPAAGLLYVDGGVDLGTVVLFLMLAMGYLTPVTSLVGTLATILIRIQLSAGAIQEILAEEELPRAAEPRRPESFGVTFDHVTFGYREDAPAVVDITLDLPAGTTTAVVGATGSGKSTLARLLARFYDPREGAVCIGGVDVRDMGATDLAATVAFIQQDEYIFETTLAENIRISRPTASDSEVADAARSAQLDIPLEQELSAGGGELSGGQRQRIAMARAFLKDAPVIVLDEATASLDAATERRTLAAVDELTRGRTVIAIAHRLSTITGSDSIVVMEDGRIAARGTHGELLDGDSAYPGLWEAYTRADGWRLEPSEDAAVAATVTPVDASSPQDTADIADIARTGAGEMGFFRQWRTLYGRGWNLLVRRGLMRLIAESLFRGAPLVAVLFVVLAAIGEVSIGDGDGLDSGSVWLITAVLAGALVLRLITTVWSNALVWRLSATSKADLQLSILDRLRHVPLGFFRRIDNGRVGGLVTSDVPMIDFQNIPQQIVGALIQPVYATVILFVVDWRLALAALVGVPVFWALTVWSDRIYHRVFADLFAARKDATKVMLEQSRGAAVLRGNPGSLPAKRYAPAMEDLASASVNMSVKATPSSTLGSIAVELGQVLLIAVGAWLYTSGAVGASVLLIFLFLSLTIYQPIEELNSLAGYRRNQQQIAAKVAEVWDEPLLPEPVSADVAPEPADHDVTLEEVTFSYEAMTDPALSRASLHAAAGEITALVGPSGSGKSTVANLIARLWDVDEGTVRLGGVDVRELGSAGVLATVTTVFQDVYLFDDTVRVNLTLGRPAATDDEIRSALEAAQCLDVVDALPEGLDTVLADGGSDLFGGQRQRLAIARALLKNSPVLILDEAVSAVDPGTEERIQSALSRLAAGRTVIVIAHRISTIRDVPHIVVVDAGCFVGSGTHEELLDSCATYRDLADEQGQRGQSSVTGTG